MDAVTVHSHISAPREQVYELIADVAARPAWTDHYAKDYRLLTPRSVGAGAGGRYRLDAPGGTRYVEFTLVEATPPRRVVEEGRTGRLGRTRYRAEYELTEPGRGVTRVAATVWTEPENAIERIRESVGLRRYLRRRIKKGLERLRRILEEGHGEPLARATIGGYEARKAPRFGTPPGHGFSASDGETAAPERRPQPGRVGE
jgi:uncharacterized protein YndB with AHSA1/START domain